MTVLASPLAYDACSPLRASTTMKSVYCREERRGSDCPRCWKRHPVSQVNLVELTGLNRARSKKSVRRVRSLRRPSRRRAGCARNAESESACGCWFCRLSAAPLRIHHDAPTRSRNHSSAACSAGHTLSVSADREKAFPEPLPGSFAALHRLIPVSTQRRSHRPTAPESLRKATEPRPRAKPS